MGWCANEGRLMNALALLEIIDRDGHVRQSFPVLHWPFTVGRALDNDVVITDPHVAAMHLSIAPTDAGLGIAVGDTRNTRAMACRSAASACAAARARCFRPAPAAPTAST
jgi:hypothetical protein